jgi:two-component system response regulator CiaR
MNVILCCDGDPYWREYLSNGLTAYRPVVVASAEEMLAETYARRFDLYLLDYYTAFEALRQLRDTGDETVALVTSASHHLSVQRTAFRIADDFIKKPYWIEELKLRIDYRLNRLYHSREEIVRCGDLIFHPKSGRLFKHRIKIELTKAERELLSLFLRHNEQYIAKYTILSELDSIDSEGSLRVIVSRLRKIGFQIENSRTLGYRAICVSQRTARENGNSRIEGIISNIPSSRMMQ